MGEKIEGAMNADNANTEKRTLDIPIIQLNTNILSHNKLLLTIDGQHLRASTRPLVATFNPVLVAIGDETCHAQKT